MGRILGIVLLVLAALVITNFILQNHLFWSIIDISMIVVSITSGLYLIIKKPK